MLNGCDNLQFPSAHRGANVLTHKVIKEAALWLPVGTGGCGTAESSAGSPAQPHGWASTENADYAAFSPVSCSVFFDGCQHEPGKDLLPKTSYSSFA